MQIYTAIVKHLKSNYPAAEWDTVGDYRIAHLNRGWYVGVPLNMRPEQSLIVGNGDNDWEITPCDNPAKEITAIMLAN